MDPVMLSMAVGVAVIAVFASVAMTLARAPAASAERRLEEISGKRARGKAGAKAKADLNSGLLLRPSTMEMVGSRKLSDNLPSLEGLARLYEQADVAFEFRYFLAINFALPVVAGIVGLVLAWPPWMAVAGAAMLAATPPIWLVMRKRKRIKMFVAQMPDALELIGRALRAGHGLASGLGVVSDEMAPPISVEFGRVYEEQNLGIPLEEALRGLADRVPIMDVRFFVTAVVIQRATGGDLAEILDKIGRIVRERFQILGQVQALTAEGRLSGIVLLALPPGLLVFTYTINPEYCGLLFSTALGTKLLGGAAVLQVLGAIAIKKIITIKV